MQAPAITRTTLTRAVWVALIIGLVASLVLNVVLLTRADSDGALDVASGAQAGSTVRPFVSNDTLGMHPAAYMRFIEDNTLLPGPVQQRMSAFEIHLRDQNIMPGDDRPNLLPFSANGEADY